MLDQIRLSTLQIVFHTEFSKTLFGNMFKAEDARSHYFVLITTPIHFTKKINFEFESIFYISQKFISGNRIFFE